MTTTEPTIDPTTPTRPKRRWLWPTAAAILFFLGIAIGGAGGGTTEPEVRTVTETETVIETVETVPAECLAALDDADELTTIAADFGGVTSTALGLAADGFVAVASFDVAEMERVNAEMEGIPAQMDALTARVNASTYVTNRDACKAAS